MKRILLLAAGAAACAVQASAEKALIFEETFANCTSTTIQGGYFTESLYFESATMGDNDGWYTQNCYMAERSIKFSAKNKHGVATTPAISLMEGQSSDITVEFRAQTWTGDLLDVNVEVVGLEGSKQTLEIDGAQQISDRSQQGCSVTFTGVPSSFQLKFSGTAREGGSGVTRFFLSDVRVLQEVAEGVAPHALLASASYNHFKDNMAGNQSERLTLSVSDLGGATGPVSVTLPENSNFELLSNEPQSDGTTLLAFGFNPHSAGAKEETATISYPDCSKQLILTGNAKVYRPMKAEASETLSDAFTASWAPCAGMDNIELVVWKMEEGPLVAPDLMITKYIEGSSNNRALEIFNGTGEAVSLNGYKFLVETNGAGGLTTCEFPLPDIELANGKCYTICNAQYSDLRDIADRTVGYNEGGYSNIMTFTGDDAIGLFNPEGTLIDLVGYESYDVNDRVSGLWGTDVSFYRRSECATPSPKFYPEQWNQYPINHSQGFGQHQMDDYGDVSREVARLMLDGSATSARVEGLEPSTLYHFAVRGHSNGLLTHYGEEATVLTSPGSGVEEVSAERSYRIEGGRLVLAPGATAFTADGRAATTAAPGALLIVRAANGKTAKVIL